MKKIFKFLTIVCFINSSAFANFFVVTSDQVNVSHEGMFVMVDGAMIPVQSLNASNDGYIVSIPMPMCDICPNCGRNTYTQGGYCSVCGFPNDDDYSTKKNATH